MNDVFVRSTDSLGVSKDIHDYHFVSQGKTTIPGVDDAAELEQTHVSSEHYLNTFKYIKHSIKLLL
jgi:hypothetical protein